MNTTEHFGFKCCLTYVTFTQPPEWFV